MFCGEVVGTVEKKYVINGAINTNLDDINLRKASLLLWDYVTHN